MKLSLRDKIATPDIWHPEKDEVGQVPLKPAPGKGAQPPAIEEVRRAIPPKLLSATPMSDGRFKKIFEDAGKKFYTIVKPDGTVVYDSRKASKKIRLQRLSAIAKKIKSSKEEWIQAREEVIMELMEQNNWTQEAAEQYCDENPEIVESKAVDKSADRAAHLMTIGQ